MLSRRMPLIAFVVLFAGTAVAPAPAYSATGATVASIPRMRFADLGRAPVAPVRLAIALHYRNEAELKSLALQLSGLSPAQRVLSAQQFLNYFSPSAADYQSTVAIFARMGFRLVKTYANRTVFDVEAPVAVVDRTFDTDIHAVIQQPIAPALGRAGMPSGLRYANVRPATLPAQLRPLVSGILGFNNLILRRPAYVLGGAGRSTGVAIGPPLYGPDGGYGPLAFAQGYNFPVQHQVRGGNSGRTYDGTGQATANVIDSDFYDSDLSAFLSYFNVTRTGPATTRVLIDGGPNPAINGDEIETDLDVETIVGTTPGTALYVYLMPDLSDQSIFDAYSQIVSDNVVDAANSSFYGCENQDPNFATMTDQIAMQGVVLGINFSASTGDLGSDCPGGTGVGSPASGPHFIAAGGTTLSVTSNGGYNGETAWDGSGGGVSTIFALPAYQNGIQNIIGNTRNTPDIAFDANPSSGASLYMNGQFDGPVGGTSLSSPLMTALITQFDQVNGSRFGDLHSLIYGGFKRLGYGTFDRLPAFRDVIGGSNGMYQCTQGYDLVTGIGSVDGAGAANAYKPK